MYKVKYEAILVFPDIECSTKVEPNKEFSEELKQEARNRVESIIKKYNPAFNCVDFTFFADSFNASDNTCDIHVDIEEVYDTDKVDYVMFGHIAEHIENQFPERCYYVDVWRWKLI